MKKILHYVYDPLCGWCYAAEAIASTLARQATDQYEFTLHAGGLFRNTRLSLNKCAQIRVADARIAELTGQIFGEKYLHGILNDPHITYDSTVPIRAILAAHAINPAYDLQMLTGLQHAHYRNGLSMMRSSTLNAVIESIGLDIDQFTKAFQKIDENVLKQHLEHSQSLMQSIGARGYPTFVAQTAERFTVLPHERYYGDATGFARLVADVLHGSETAPSEVKPSEVKPLEVKTTLI